MNIVVQKYGGTSVSTEASRGRIADNARKLVEEGKSPVIVVSAMGRNGAPYATDTLIGLYGDSCSVKEERDLDLMMSCGETISAVVLSATIRQMGLEAVALTGYQAGIMTDTAFGNANVLSVKTGRIMRELEAGKVVVVTGFQGMTEFGDITTLGRGGSDTTAAILGEALDASSIEIFTDVDGVMTADPRLVPSARVIDKISYEECYQMAVDGAKVVDHKAVEVARRSGKVLKIKNTFTDAEGTTISLEAEQAPHVMKKRIITAIASKPSVVQFTVDIDYMDPRNESFLNAFEAQEISLDLINFFENQKIFTIDAKRKDKAAGILTDLDVPFAIVEDCCKLTAVGYRIHGVPGVMKRIVLALSKAGIEILQSGDSHTTIACLIRTRAQEKAMRALHAEFGLNEE